MSMAPFSTPCKGSRLHAQAPEKGDGSTPADGRMDAAERRSISKEGHDVIDQVKRLLASVEPPGERAPALVRSA